MVYALVAATIGHVLARFRDDVDDTVAGVEGGRFSSSPFEMTWAGWMEIFHRTGRSAIDDRIMTVAASVAFYALLSFVPGLSVLVTIYGIFVSPASIPGQIALMTDLFPEAARALIQEQAVRLATQSSGSLSITLVVSLGIAGWSANAAVKALFEALNTMWGKVDTRSFIRLNLESLLFTFTGMIVTVIVLVGVTDIPGYLTFLPIGATMQSMLALLRWPLVYLAGLGAIVMVYRRGPCRTPPGVIWTLPGAILASVVWMAASVLFSWYVSTLASYTATYGSLAAVVVTMTWLWLSAIVLLAGAELSSQIERQIYHGGHDAAPKATMFANFGL